MSKHGAKRCVLVLHLLEPVMQLLERDVGTMGEADQLAENFTLSNHCVRK